jgi:hypothetical protein
MFEPYAKYQTVVIAAVKDSNVVSQKSAEYLITSPQPSPGRRGSKRVPSPSGRGAG